MVEGDGPQAKRARVQPKLKLYYFNIKGKGEPLRLIMHHAGLEFEDVRLAKEEFLERKARGEFTFGQVPTLAVDQGCGSTQLVQTAAIARFLAKLVESAELYPADPLIAAKVDAIIDQEVDMTTGVVCAKYQERFGYDGALGGPGGEGAQMVERALGENVLPRHLAFFEALLETSPSGWLAGTTGPTIADFLLVPRFEWLRTGAGLAGVDGAKLFARCPRICVLMKKFNDLASVKEWKARDPLILPK